MQVTSLDITPVCMGKPWLPTTCEKKIGKLIQPVNSATMPQKPNPPVQRLHLQQPGQEPNDPLVRIATSTRSPGCIHLQVVEKTQDQSSSGNSKREGILDRTKTTNLGEGQLNCYV